MWPHPSLPAWPPEGMTFMEGGSNGLVFLFFAHLTPLIAAKRGASVHGVWIPPLGGLICVPI